MTNRAARCYLAKKIEENPAIRVLKEERIQDLLLVIANLDLCFAKWLPAEAAHKLELQNWRR